MSNNLLSKIERAGIQKDFLLFTICYEGNNGKFMEQFKLLDYKDIAIFERDDGAILKLDFKKHNAKITEIDGNSIKEFCRIYTIK